MGAACSRWAGFGEGAWDVFATDRCNAIALVWVGGWDCPGSSRRAGAGSILACVSSWVDQSNAPLGARRLTRWRPSRVRWTCWSPTRGCRRRRRRWWGR
jgi:hypothetical protein